MEHEDPSRQPSAGSHNDLIRVLREPMSATGPEFFHLLARSLSEISGAAHAFVAAPADADYERARMLGYWSHGGRAAGFDYELAGTPCAGVAAGALVHHERGLTAAFPDVPRLAEWQAESYLGLPLRGPSGARLGHLAVLDTRPLPRDQRMLALMQLLAARAVAELERAAAEERLRASEQQFRDLFEEAPIAYVYEDNQTRFVSANRAAIRLLGLRPEEVRGTVGRSLLPPTSESHMMADEIFADIQQGKERGALEFELRRKSDGQPIWVQFWSRPEPDGKHTRTMLIDITDRVRAEQERNRLRHQNEYLREEIKSASNFDEIVGSSPRLRAVLDKVQQVAPTTSTVLILGETGTGKELIARAIHNCSARRDGPLIKLNCAALPTGLIESELFGHEKGAFTGALERRIGRFALADRGTIFLDEVGDLPADVQVRLLRVLQEQEFEPVGSTRTMKVDVRVIAATNRDLERAVAAGSFRADLFYRLNVFPIELPPLRERVEDVSKLAHYFVTRCAAKVGKHFDGIEPPALERLRGYAWPGNIRELQNVIERAVILSPGPLLELDPGALGVAPSARPPAGEERQQILEALETCGWTIEGAGGAARRLGLHPNTLRSRMKKHGIRRSGA